MNTNQKGEARMTRTKESQQGFTPGRVVIANDDTGKWEVHEDKCWLAEFESESLAYEFAAAPELLDMLINVAIDLENGRLQHSEGNDLVLREVNDLITKTQGKG